MSYLRPRQRLDGPHTPILRALLRVGRPAISLAAVGGGCPDILAQHMDGHLVLLEVKAASGRLRPKQKTFRAVWPVEVTRTENEALRAVGVIERALWTKGAV